MSASQKLFESSHIVQPIDGHFGWIVIRISTDICLNLWETPSENGKEHIYIPSIGCPLGEGVKGRQPNQRETIKSNIINLLIPSVNMSTIFQSVSGLNSGDVGLRTVNEIFSLLHSATNSLVRFSAL